MIAYIVLTTGCLAVIYQLFTVRKAAKRAERLDKLYRQETQEILDSLSDYWKR